MNLDEIRASDKVYLTPAEIAPVLGCDPQGIRIMARSHPDLLGFPVIVLGRKEDSLTGARIKIPRLPFLAYVTGGKTGGGAEAGRPG